MKVFNLGFVGVMTTVLLLLPANGTCFGISDSLTNNAVAPVLGKFGFGHGNVIFTDKILIQNQFMGEIAKGSTSLTSYNPYGLPALGQGAATLAYATYQANELWKIKETLGQIRQIFVEQKMDTKLVEKIIQGLSQKLAILMGILDNLYRAAYISEEEFKLLEVETRCIAKEMSDSIRKLEGIKQGLFGQIYQTQNVRKDSSSNAFWSGISSIAVTAGSFLVTGVALTPVGVIAGASAIGFKMFEWNASSHIEELHELLGSVEQCMNGVVEMERQISNVDFVLKMHMAGQAKIFRVYAAIAITLAVFVIWMIVRRGLNLLKILLR